MYKSKEWVSTATRPKTSVFHVLYAVSVLGFVSLTVHEVHIQGHA